MPDRTDPPAPRPARRRMLMRRRRSILALAALVLLTALGMVGVRLAQGSDSAAAPSGAAPTSSTPQATVGSASPPGSTSDEDPAGPTSSPTESQPKAAIAQTPAMPATIPASGSGSTTVLQPAGADSDRTGRRVRYTVEVERGLGVPEQHFAAAVREVLTDSRGWEPTDGVHFVNVGPRQRAEGAAADVRIILGSPAYVDQGCLPLRTMGNLSCHANGKVLLNVRRWAQGAETYDDITAYRTYLVNHEVGHALGHSHRACPGKGRAAPLMVQQTKSLYGCTPWPWPQPPTN